MNIAHFAKSKENGEKISFLTCYDYWTAQILNSSQVDGILVGDSLAMVMHGADSTVEATMEQMVLHTQAVKKGAPDKFIVGDLPFLSHRGSLDHGLENVRRLMAAGAHAVKLEGIDGNEQFIAHVIESGVPVMAHLGLRPQSVNTLGGYKVQGKLDSEAQKIIKDSERAEALGCFSLILECIPQNIGTLISQKLKIPAIGIGAGAGTDGQILVMQDMLGAFEKNAKFVRRYRSLNNELREAFNEFDQDVKSSQYPNKEEIYDL